MAKNTTKVVKIELKSTMDFKTSIVLLIKMGGNGIELILAFKLPL